MDGGAGDDSLRGSDGTILTGGSGADHFNFAFEFDVMSMMTITDFENDIDTLEFRQYFYWAGTVEAFLDTYARPDGRDLTIETPDAKTVILPGINDADILLDDLIL